MKNAETRFSQGFTLIEILVVVAIIGILSTVVLSSLNSARSKSRDVRRSAEVREIVTALELYRSDHGKFPCHSIQYSDDSDFLQPLITEGYLGSKPEDPLNPSYVYTYMTAKETSGGPCGQIFQIGYYFENAASKCALGGFKPNPTHCHVLYPTVLPCSDPYASNPDTWPPSAPDCSALGDTSADNDY